MVVKDNIHVTSNVSCILMNEFQQPSCPPGKWSAKGVVPNVASPCSINICHINHAYLKYDTEISKSVQTFF